MNQKVKKIYLDYAATTPLDPLVKKAMEPYLTDDFGNPSSIHSLGRAAKVALEDARKTVARVFHCRSSEIIFTGSGTESINLAILGTAHFYSNVLKNIGIEHGHLITTKIEHHAVLNSVQVLEKEGLEITYLGVDKNGWVDPKKLKAALRPDTILVSVMYANNEIGTIEPIVEISKIIKDFRREVGIRNKELGKQEKPIIHNSLFMLPVFHVDACQAAGYSDLNVEKLGVDLMSVNGSKIYGPKGVGALYVRSGVKLEPIIYGGGQEQNLRSGTENVAGIVGFAKALEIAQEMKEKEGARLEKLRDYFVREVLKLIPDAVLNGDPEKRLPNNVNISISGVEGDAAVLYLDEKGIAISTGSACSSVSIEPSHVILALGRSREYALGSLRFSFGRAITKKDLDYTLKSLAEVVNLLRHR
ncbi:MAG: cysteine desulfurase [Candidatus Sungbacteria bacterium]|nr:cysteine desulfurase [Candidatus Sungbacteria bacterium]